MASDSSEDAPAPAKRDGWMWSSGEKTEISLKRPPSVANMGAALNKLREASLRHDDVVQLRTDTLDQSLSEMQAPLDEPVITNRASVRVWQEWARKRAMIHADEMHPRREVEGAAGLDRMVPLPLFCSAAEFTKATGAVPALYFDFLKFAAVYSAIGAVLSLPSLITSLAECDNSYPDGFTGTQSLACTAVGARATCSTDWCKFINFLLACTEVFYTLLLLSGFRRFRACVPAPTGSRFAPGVGPHPVALLSIRPETLPCPT